MNRADRIRNMCQVVKKACENVVEAQEKGYGLRYGQALFNALYMIRPDLSNQIVGGPIDPFYCEEDDDPKIVAFCDWIVENW